MLADANFILRILLNDNQEQCDYAINKIKKHKVRITNEVLAEIVYVLEKVNEVSKGKISDILTDFLNSDLIISNSIQKMALHFFKTENIDFVDCVLLAYNYDLKEDVLTFDKKLQNKLLK